MITDKKFKKFAKTFIFTILIVSLFLSIIPKTSAGAIRINSHIDVSWSDVEEPIIPRDEIKMLNLTVEYRVELGGDVAAGILDTISAKALVNMRVVDHSPWCTANIRRDTVPLTISTSTDRKYNQLNIQLTPEAPAYGLGYVTIESSVSQLGWIPPFSTTDTLSFVPAYLPIIDSTLLEGNNMEIGPMDSAVFPVEIENMGNARTKVMLKVESITDGWTAAVTDEVTLGEDVGSTSDAYVTIKPPKTIGYHDDDGIVKISLTPARAESLSDKGETSYLTFIVKSRGYSTPGFEGILLLVAISMFLVFMKLKKRNK